MINITMALLLSLSFAKGNMYCMYSNCPVNILRFNCADFSAGLTLLLRANNFITYPMCGWSIDHHYHAWVGVELNGVFYNIEPQFGTLINGNMYAHSRRCIVRGVV